MTFTCNWMTRGLVMLTDGDRSKELAVVEGKIGET